MSLDKDKLPPAITYYEDQSLKLIGSGAWRNAICPFHEDTKPSLRVHPLSGAFACMACGAKGGDVLALIPIWRVTLPIGECGLKIISTKKRFFR